MKYVLDSAVAPKWVLPEIYADKAKRLRDDYENQIHELIAPDVFAWKFRTLWSAPNARRSSRSARRQRFSWT